MRTADKTREAGMNPAQGSLFPVSERRGTPLAITIRQPWASLIMIGVKTVENRDWQADYRGTLVIHAGKGIDREAMREHGHLIGGEYPAGAIIGVVDLVGCVRDSPSPWAVRGQWHWLLANPRPCVPVPVRGKLGLWRVSDEDWPRTGLA